MREFRRVRRGGIRNQPFHLLPKESNRVRQPRLSCTAPVLSGVFVGFGLLYSAIRIGPHIGLLPAPTSPWWQTAAGIWVRHTPTGIGAGLLALVALSVLETRFHHHRF